MSFEKRGIEEVVAALPSLHCLVPTEICVLAILDVVGADLDVHVSLLGRVSVAHVSNVPHITQFV